MIFRILSLIVLSIAFAGCLVVSKVSYHIVLKDKQSGTATVTFHNIRSDAIGNKEFEEDKRKLFKYFLTSDEFAGSLEQEGRFIKSRNLDVVDGKLTGVVEYAFNDIEKIESIRYDGGLYYLTLQSDDEVVSTNGDIISTDQYKRIIWREGVKELKFEIASGQSQQRTRDLAPFLKKTP